MIMRFDMWFELIKKLVVIRRWKGRKLVGKGDLGAVLGLYAFWAGASV